MNDINFKRGNYDKPKSIKAVQKEEKISPSLQCT